MSYSSTILGESGLVSYWRLGETSGTTATDSKGSNNGTYTSGYTLGADGLIVGDSDKGVTLNGSSGYVDVPAASNLRPSNVTVEAWIKINTATNGVCVVASNSFSSNVGFELGLGFVAGNNQTPQFGTYNGSWTAASSSNGALPASNAHIHLVGTYDGTNLKLYINGILMATTAFSGPLVYDANNLKIGKRPDTGVYFNGVIDEVAIYNTALSDSQIYNHWIAGPSSLSIDTAIIIHDAFTDTNNTGLQSHTPDTAPGSWSITTNGDYYIDTSNNPDTSHSVNQDMCRSLVTINNGHEAWLESNLSNGTITCQMLTTNTTNAFTNAYGQIRFRRSDSSNFWCFQGNQNYGNDTWAMLRKCVSGSYSDVVILHKILNSWTNSHWGDFKIVAYNNVILLYTKSYQMGDSDFILRGIVTDSFNNTATKIGIGIEGGNQSQYYAAFNDLKMLSGSSGGLLRRTAMDGLGGSYFRDPLGIN
jgi:putative transposon-encoded protein